MMHEMQHSFGEDFSNVTFSPGLSSGGFGGGKAVATEENIAYDPGQKDVATSALDKTTGAASSVWNKTKSVASSAWDKTKSVASSAWDKTKGAASSAWGKVKEYGGTALRKVGEGAAWASSSDHELLWDALPMGMGVLARPAISAAVNKMLGRDKVASSELDNLQFKLDVIGVLDPTPLSDGINAVISLARGNYTDAALSGISMLPYARDLIGKGGKALKYISKIPGLDKVLKKVPGIARKGWDLAKPLVKRGLDKIAPLAKKGWDHLAKGGRWAAKKWDGIVQGVKKVPGFFRDKWNNLRKGLKDGAGWAVKKWKGIRAGIKKAPGWLYDKWRAARSEGSKLLRKGWDAGKKWLGDTWNKYAPGWMKQGAKWVDEKAQALKRSLRRAYNRIVHPYPHTKAPGPYAGKPVHPTPSPQWQAGANKAKHDIAKSHTDPNSIWDQKFLNDPTNPNGQALKHSLDEFAAGNKGQSIKDLDLSKKTGKDLHDELIDKGFSHKREPLTTDVNGQREFVLSKPDSNGKMTTTNPSDPNIVPQDIYTHPDGGMVRAKPEGDTSSKFRTQPQASKSVLHDPKGGIDLSSSEWFTL